MQLLSIAFTVLAVLLGLTSSAIGGGECKHPSVRREWRSLSNEERAEWIRAVKCLAKWPHDERLAPSVDPSISLIPPINRSSSYNDDISYMHMDLNTKIHWTGLFLPWHRWYVHVHEQAMKEKCGFTGTQPYWDWSKDSAAPDQSPLFLDGNPHTGFGSVHGDPNHDHTVVNGAFTDLMFAYPAPHRLRRVYNRTPWDIYNASSFTPNPEKFAGDSINPSEVHKLITEFDGNYTGFQAYFEGFQGAHSAIHLMMGGDMGGEDCPASAPNCVTGPKWTANEPMFWMHHGMVDKIWSEWQHHKASNFWLYAGGSVEEIDTPAHYDKYPTGGPPFLSLDSMLPADGLFPEVPIRTVMDTTGGYLCYVYE
ncbi:Di-copper centre-containing protein [Punctularia strigosozonata HHB-11173 SS5]|uniref:Di-copper centre-containing protein n=1 Tax=Punctularia strigosozonata (strain HHB-11173) TaxID=741275 RepID=UPI000441718B|nr:Di-copper centre-containing protein [Punctularia strigosozonata HHB-11173 SS5]EIN05385.1 Di-copper centre-containing protein [Punctularia strigosozonata HHB-11173 SS5]